MLQIEEAAAVLCRRAAPLAETERISLTQALGRITASDCTARYDQPPFPRSPLDGYALRGEDTVGATREHPMTLKVVGKIYAGEVFSETIRPGEALRLMTGAPIPEGANTVIRQEDTDRGEENVRIYASSQPWQNYCPQGEDYHAGDVLIPAHTKLNGAAVSVLASLGCGEVEVIRQAKVAVFSTGDEVIQPGEPLAPGKIYDSNRFYVTTRLAELGNPACSSRHCPDDAASVAEAIRTAAETCDLIITTGGVSVGEKDIMHEVIRLLGAEQLFWRVAIKPGAPTLAAVYQGVPVVCLSGNPYGAAANFELLVRPVMEQLTGDRKWRMKKKRSVLTNDFPKQGRVRRFLRGYTRHGQVRVQSGNQASGALSSLLGSNCLIEIPPEQCGAEKGKEVWVYML